MVVASGAYQEPSSPGVRRRARSGDRAAALERLPQSVPAARRRRPRRGRRQLGGRDRPGGRPAVTGPGCRGGTRGTNRSASGAGRTGWSLPLFWFVAMHVLTMRTPVGRKVRPEFRSNGSPLARVRREGPRRRRGRAGAEDGGRPGRLAGAGGRTGPRRRERDVVHRDSCRTSRGSTFRSSTRTGTRARPRGRADPSPACTSSGCYFLYAFASVLIGGVGTGRRARRQAHRVAPAGRPARGAGPAGA